MKDTTHWVVGLLFNNSQTQIVLISKTHPPWQAGKLNGVGGRINDGETPLEAMRREFSEEAGATVDDWREFALLRVKDGDVHFLVARGGYEIHSGTEETVNWYPLTDIENLPVIKNLEWLIPLALDPKNENAVIEYS